MIDERVVVIDTRRLGAPACVGAHPLALPLATLNLRDYEGIRGIRVITAG